MKLEISEKCCWKWIRPSEHTCSQSDVPGT